MRSLAATERMPIALREHVAPASAAPTVLSVLVALEGLVVPVDVPEEVEADPPEALAPGRR